jgi:predicted membrane protein
MSDPSTYLTLFKFIGDNWIIFYWGFGVMFSCLFATLLFDLYKRRKKLERTDAVFVTASLFLVVAWWIDLVFFMIIFAICCIVALCYVCIKSGQENEQTDNEQTDNVTNIGSDKKIVAFQNLRY